MKVPIGTDIYLKFGKRLKVPVNPEEITITTPSKNETFDVLDKGEIVIPMPAGLTEVSFESYLPSDDDDPFMDGSASPKKFIKTLKSAKEKRIKGRLIISRSELFDTNIRCVVEEFTTTDKGGEPGDLYYSIKLREYRDYSPQVVNIIQPSVSNEAVTASADSTAQATTTTERPVETPVMRVGAQVIANGTYCNDSYGSKPHGAASNLSATVQRIVSGREYPILVGSYGWMQESALQVVG